MKFAYEIRNIKNTDFAITNTLTWGAHLHKEAELIYVIKGNPIAYVQGIKYNLAPGEAVAVYPNQVHSYENNGEFKGSVMIFDPRLYPELNGLIIGKTPSNPVISAKTLESCGFPQLHDRLCRKFSENCPAAVKKGVILVTAGILMSASNLKNSKHVPDNTFDSIFNYCFTHFKTKFTLDQMASDLALSNSYLSHLFSERIQMSFNDYINSIRINYACTLLNETDLGITQIATASGFSTIRTFNRAFLKLAGKTPTEYKNI